MSHFFLDRDDYGGYDPPSSQLHQIAGYEPPEKSAEDEDDEAVMADVENRLDIGNYYRAFLDTEIFGEDRSEVALFVQKKIRRMARRELEDIMGLRSAPVAPPQPVQSPFSPEELQALKLLAQKLMSGEKVAPQRPEVRTTTVAPPPAVEVKPVGRPQVATTQVPQSTPAVATKPRRLVSKRAQTQAQTAPPEPPTERTPEPPGAEKERRLVNAPGVEKRGGRPIRVIEFPDTGERIVQDFSPQQVPTRRLPMPEGGQMTMISQQIATDTISATGRNPQLRIAALANGAVNTPTE